MPKKPIVHLIPAKPIEREMRVGIYARVSSNSTEQLNSLISQVSALTRLTATATQWLLVDTYIDIATSKTGSSRKGFTRMLGDCHSKNIDIVLTKSISRFGRDTVEVLDALKQFKALNVRVIFEQESLDTADAGDELMISIIASIAQAENESRSDNIKWGIKQRAAQGTSKLYDRKCYGYENDKNGRLIIDDFKAKNVQLIFNLYLGGKSIVGIITELEKLGIKSPMGKEKWSKRTIDFMLSNEKYIGTVRLLNSGKYEFQYVSTDNNPAIITDEQFKLVQNEKLRRSNVVRGKNGNRRKDTKYSSKK